MENIRNITVIHENFWTLRLILCAIIAILGGNKTQMRETHARCVRVGRYAIDNLSNMRYADLNEIVCDVTFGIQLWSDSCFHSEVLPHGLLNIVSV